MKKMFPYIENFSSDSLYVELKNEFEKNSEYVKRQKIIEKSKEGGKIAGFLYLFKLSGILFGMKSVEKYIFILILLAYPCFIFILSLFIKSSPPPSATAIYIILEIISVIMALCYVNSFFSPVFINFRDVEKCFYNYNYMTCKPELMDKIYPEFFGKMLNKGQMIKLKDTVRKDIFKDALNKETLSISYQSALKAICYDYYLKNQHKISEEKELLESEIERIYNNLK